MSKKDAGRKYYHDEMNNFLNSSKLPPTRYELNLMDNRIRSETKKRFNCDEKVFTDEFKSIESNYKERRHEMLLEAVLGTKNYVPQIN